MQNTERPEAGRRITEERACLMTPAGMEVLHAEISLRDKDGQAFYVQAHDNGTNRYYALTTQSWFALQDSDEEEEDPIEEYTTASTGDAEEAEPDFSMLLREQDRREMPYEDSDYADYFVKADRLLDDLAESADAE